MLGMGIEFSGLAARADLNGKKGLVIQHVVDKDRWRVIVEDSAEEVSVKATNLQTASLQELTPGLSSPTKRTKRTHHRQLNSLKRTVIPNSQQPPGAGLQQEQPKHVEETVIDRATGARHTMSQMKQLEQRRKQQLLQRHDNKEAASRKRSAVLVMGESRSTQHGRTKRLVEQTMSPGQAVSDISNARDGGTVDGGALGGVRLGGVAGGWEMSGSSSFAL